MNAQVRADLLTTPRPADADDVKVHLIGGHWRVVWVRAGRVPEAFGPAFAQVAEAARAAVLVREAHGLR